MKEFAATTSIHAAPEPIWSILTDAPRYPEWNPTVDKVDGERSKREAER